MSAQSDRTKLRDFIISVMTARAGVARVPVFVISKKYISLQDPTLANTYCIFVTDETRQDATYNFNNWTMTIQVLCYSNDTTDPYGIVDAMIEDLVDAMAIVNTHASIKNTAWRMLPGIIKTEDATAPSWGKGVCTWTMDHIRR